jgi:hypothetical protein
MITSLLTPLSEQTAVHRVPELANARQDWAGVHGLEHLRLAVGPALAEVRLSSNEGSAFMV